MVEGRLLICDTSSLLSAGADASISVWDLDFTPPAAGEKCVLEPAASVR